jgi:signal transduction histidine kinase
MKTERKGAAWVLLIGLLLVTIALLLSAMVRKLEKDQLFLLEEDMVNTARTLAPSLAQVLKEELAGQQQVQDKLETTQNVTGSRIRVLSEKRDVLYDSLGSPPDSQDYLKFRPEVQAAFVGQYGAYTRYSDETQKSLALFVAWPVRQDGRIVGCVYVSHTTDEILQQLGFVRKSANRAVLVLSLAALLGAFLVTGQLRNTLNRLRALTSGVDNVEAKDIDLAGSDQVAQIGQNFNRLVANLRKKVSELEDERTKTRKFLEDVAHELKTPITGLAGSVEALRTKEVKLEDRERLLDNVERETARLSELTSRLLELQKLEYETLNAEPLDIVSVAETVVDSLEPAARRKNVGLRLADSDSLIAVGDARKIQRVLENLVDNAIRCTPSEEEVVITLERQDTDIVVCVLDRGPGPPDQELFNRNNQGKRFQGSLGLGLAIASEIMEMHGKSLEARPREGGGSCFLFTLEVRPETPALEPVTQD